MKAVKKLLGIYNTDSECAGHGNRPPLPDRPYVSTTTQAPQAQMPCNSTTKDRFSKLAAQSLNDFEISFANSEAARDPIEVSRVLC